MFETEEGASVMYGDEIDWVNIKVGKQYLYEESYYIQANVTIIADESDDEMIGFKVRVDEWIGGMMSEKPVGSEFSCSKRRDGEGAYLLKLSFKPVGSSTEYWFYKPSEGEETY